MEPEVVADSSSEDTEARRCSRERGGGGGPVSSVAVTDSSGDGGQSQSTNPPPVDDKGFNSKTVRCLRCSSLILQPHVGSLVSGEELIRLELPSIYNSAAGANEVVSSFWLVDDIYAFDNMGFSYTVRMRNIRLPSSSSASPALPESQEPATPSNSNRNQEHVHVASSSSGSLPDSNIHVEPDSQEVTSSTTDDDGVVADPSLQASPRLEVSTDHEKELKYLACADCDLSPIGCYDPVSKKSYLATARVAYR